MPDFEITRTIGAKGQSSVFLFCDHAGNAIPKKFSSLGLGDDLLQDHIAFDPGAAALTQALADKLQARALFCQFSRLLIDPNRGVERDDLILQISDTIEIPGNQGLTHNQRQTRIQEYFDPYHQLLSEELDALGSAHSDPFVVSIHSFAQKIRSSEVIRPWQIGLLWCDDEASAQALMKHLQKNEIIVGDNQPYSAKLYNYSVNRHIVPRGFRHITLEVRQDLLADRAAINRMRDLLFPPLQALIRGR